MNSRLQDKLDNLPAKPGVYQHKDAAGKPLYIGKAKNLRNRVRSYFQENRPRDGRLAAMIAKIEDVDVIVTDTEVEALILENNLIKRHKPRYNVNLRDDKSFPFICIKNERFPRVFPTRTLRRDGSKYFGPYTVVKNMKLMLHTIRSLFKLRTCSLRLDPEPIAAGKYQTCLEYHIKKCAGPCVGLQSEEAYDVTIRQVIKLLEGKTADLIDLLEDEMKRHASSMRFEDAADLRDRVAALKKYSERQKVVTQDLIDRDLFGLHIDRVDDIAVGVLFKVRDGKVVGKQHKYIRRLDERPESEIMQSLLEWYYTEATFFPDEVLLSAAPNDPSALEDYLHERRQKKVPLKTPERGDKAGLIRMVQANAKLLLEEYKIEKAKQAEGRIPHAVKTLQKDLRLPDLPRRIECFDISHLGGTGTVASCVVFEDGRPKKSEYRTFKIRRVRSGTPDDFESMREVVQRRYRRVNENDGPWPDLVVIDGGKGQLSSAVEALNDIGVYGRFPIVGLAKRLEEVFFPVDTESIQIPRTSASLQLLQRVRNEAHRFAITIQRKQRKKSTLTSELLEIQGVGKATAGKLLRTFGSVKRIREADAESLADVVGRSVANKIRRHFDS
ncbi:MAG: excinuclease ABC subunit UvrC [Rhodothermales bacterium]|nr:excinuclease ABC subunit UvrC [Rhodothermales bacterium]